jgi:hypothetical protein
MNFDAIIALFQEFDPAAFIPELDTVIGKLELAMRIAVMIGPIVLLFLGLWYLLLPPKEANFHAGFRILWGMGSVQAWRFTQKIAGIVWSALGLILTVVMLLICNGYRDMDAMAMAYSAVKCIFWQIGLVLVSAIGVHITVIVFFDFKGNPRQLRKKKVRAPKRKKPAQN